MKPTKKQLERARKAAKAYIARRRRERQAHEPEVRPHMRPDDTREILDSACEILRTGRNADTPEHALRIARALHAPEPPPEGTQASWEPRAKPTL